jgi:hypothetical protein
MPEQKNNIRVLFTPKADSALDDIISAFNLEETPEEFIKINIEGKLPKIVIIDRLTQGFAKGTISEKDLINSLQKDLAVPQQTAEKISKEIITKIVPFLEKVPEENLKDPAFVDEIAQKIFGEVKEKPKMELGEGESLDISPKFGTPANVVVPTERIVPTTEEKQKTKNATPQKKQERIKKPAMPEEVKETAPQIRQTKGPDSYREPIE